MQIGIIGFQKTGKTTVFNALTGQDAAVSAFSTGKTEPNLAVTPVPDHRLERLSELYSPKKTTPATVQYVDLAGIARKAGETGEGLGEGQLHAISQADALMAVLRGFQSAAGDPPDIASEAEAIVLEMILSDLKKVETRLARLAKSKGKAADDEKQALALEQAALERIAPALESGDPVRSVELSDDEIKVLRGFQFMTQKPLLLIVNAPEDALSEEHDPAAPILAMGEQPGVCVTWIAGQAEAEIATLAPEERDEFLAGYGIEEPAAAKINRLSFALLDLMTFITVGADECRCWTLRRGALAPQAAGVIHSDLERGFIRAEVCRWDELLEAGSQSELKKLGKVRVEGKNYEVKDGDVVNVLFSV